MGGGKTLACRHRAHSGRPDCDDAVLWRNARSGGGEPRQLARPRPPESSECRIVEAALAMLRRFAKPSICALILTALVAGALGGINSWADNDLPRIKFLA